MFVICLASSGMMNTPMWRHRAAPSFPKSEKTLDAKLTPKPQVERPEAGD